MKSQSYEKDYAGIYDLFYTDKDYEGEGRFVAGLIKEKAEEASRPRVLDLACGTGRHLEILHGLGCDISGVDISEGMLSQAEKRLGAKSLSVPLHCQDMRTFKLDGERFDAIVCMFDSIGYALTNDGVRQTLRRVREHLKDRGVFIFEFWHTSAMLRNYDPCRVRKIVSGDTEILRISQTDIDFGLQIATVKYTFVEQFPSGQRMWDEAHRNRFFAVPEMDLLLESEGFESRRFFPGFEDTGRKLDDSVWHIVGAASIKS